MYRDVFVYRSLDRGLFFSWWKACWEISTQDSLCRGLESRHTQKYYSFPTPGLIFHPFQLCIDQIFYLDLWVLHSGTVWTPLLLCCLVGAVSIQVFKALTCQCCKIWPSRVVFIRAHLTHSFSNILITHTQKKMFVDFWTRLCCASPFQSVFMPNEHYPEVERALWVGDFLLP